MPRPYEAVYIFDSALEEAAINEKLSRFHALVPQSSGEQPRLNHWGKRTLAYPINRFYEGVYILHRFQMPPAGTDEVDRLLRYSEDVMRYLLMRNDD